MGSRFTLRLLGGFALDRGGETVAVSSRKSRALLAYLALQPDRAHSREKLATLLWGDRFDKQARQSLRQAITVLRKELGAASENEVLLGDRDQLAVDAAAVTSDVQEFRAALASGTPAGLRRALDLYRGDLLPDFTAEAEEFDAWLDEQRQQLRHQAETAFERLSRELAAAGNGDEAIAVAQRLVALDPAQESAHRLLIELTARFRGRDAAVRRFEQCAAALRRELDAAPAPETLALIRTIKNGAALADPVSPPVPTPRHRDRRVAMVAAAAIGLVIGAAALWMATRPAEKAGTANGREPALESPFSVVVLPFSDYSDVANAPLAEAITDDITTDISVIAGTFVIARVTAATYAGKTGDIKAIGRELGVRYALEGGVRLADGQLRINADLIDTETGAYVWARRITGDSGHRLDVQDELIAALLNEVFFEVSLLDAVRSARDRPENPAPEDFLIRGRAARLRGPTPQNIAEARAMYTQALRSAPDSPFAMAGLAAAYVHGVLQMQSEDPAHDLAEADALIGRVLAERPRSYFGWFISGQIKRARGQFEQAIEDWKRSLAINASFPHAYAQIGSTLPYLGRASETAGYIERAMRLSPRDPMIPLWQLMLGASELFLEHDQAALDLLRQSAASNLRIPRAYFLLAAALVLTGDLDGARNAVATFRSLAGRGVQVPVEEAYIDNPVYLQQRARISEALRQAGL